MFDEPPQTWDELIAVCDQLKAAGIDPFYGTFKDDWTVAQGWYDFTVTVSSDPAWIRRATGHIETGSASVTG